MKKMRKIQVAATYELPMLETIDDYIEEHDISFSEFSRRAAASYLSNHNQTVTEVSINDSKLTEAIKDIPKDTEPPSMEDTKKNPNDDFNFDDLNIK